MLIYTEDRPIFNLQKEVQAGVLHEVLTSVFSLPTRCRDTCTPSRCLQWLAGCLDKSGDGTVPFQANVHKHSRHWRRMTRLGRLTEGISVNSITIRTLSPAQPWVSRHLPGAWKQNKKKEIQILGLKWKQKHLISAGTEQRRPNSSGLLWENSFWPESASRLACLYKKTTGFQSLCKTIQQRLSGRFCVLLGWTLTSMLQSIYPLNYNLPATNNNICNPVDVFAKKKVNWCTVCLSFWCFASDSTHASLLG